MIDMRPTVIPKSDQLNADSLIGGPKTIKVTKVSLLPEADQPIAISFEGDDGKPYKPAKSMRRVMVNIWGPDGNTYIGRSMTIYRDDKVMFGGVNVGGIRISHMSHIDAPVTMALTVARANRKPFTVHPLAIATPRVPNGVQIDATLRAQGDDAASRGKDFFIKFWNGLGRDQRIAVGGTPQRDIWLEIAKEADESPPPGDDLWFPDNNSSPSPSQGSTGEEAAAGQSSPAERRAGSATSDLEDGPAPVPQGMSHFHASNDEAKRDNEPAGPGPVTTVLAAESAASASTPRADAAPTDLEQHIKRRTAEILASGDAVAQTGTAALRDYLEHLRKNGEDGLVTSVRKSAWNDAAKAADAAKGRKG